VPTTYYVNDASTTNDEWCSAVGSDANDGMTPATPKATVQAVLTAYPLQAGDTVCIDTGTYNLSGNITVGTQNVGTAANPIVFQHRPTA